MTQTGSVKEHDSYRHEAFLHRGQEEFLAGTVPFVREGVRAGQPVMVAVPAPRLALVRAALGDDADGVVFVDMTELGHNPARIIPAWQEFAASAAEAGRPARGIGEPVWAGRTAAELAECQLHEALLNMAVDPDTPLWLRCPYDGATLSAPLLEAAHRTHPILVGVDDYRGSTSYGGADHVLTLFADELPEPAGGSEDLVFGPQGLAAVRRLVERRGTGAGLGRDRTADLALAVHELALNSTEHGGGRGALRVWQEPGVLVCEVRDRGRIDDPLVGRRMPPPQGEGGRGVWLANQLCDLVQVRSTAQGTAVRVLTRLGQG